jgi:protein-arginine kinase activator protein McsA
MGGIKLDDAQEYFYGTLIDAMEEILDGLVEDELYEKACIVRDEIIELKKKRQLERNAAYTGRKINV